MKWWLSFLPALWIACSIQSVVGATGTTLVQLPLLVLAVFSVFGSRTQAILAGILCGVIEGGVVGSNLGAFVMTRLIVALVATWIEPDEVELRGPFAFIWGLGFTLAALVMFRLGVPWADFGTFALVTISCALLNGILAIPAFAAARKFLALPRR
jgi:hypothetical protein